MFGSRFGPEAVDPERMSHRDHTVWVELHHRFSAAEAHHELDLDVVLEPLPRAQLGDGLLVSIAPSNQRSSSKATASSSTTPAQLFRSRGTAVRATERHLRKDRGALLLQRHELRAAIVLRGE